MENKKDRSFIGVSTLIVSAWTLCVLVPAISLAQLPDGTISGVVVDVDGGVMSSVQVEIVSRATGHVRGTITGAQGEYNVPTLLPGDYDVIVEAAGFKRTVRAATVEAGTDTRTDLVLQVGAITESLTVAAAAPQIHYDSPAVSGTITHAQVEGLPLNGRSFLELAKLEPGVRPPAAANRNRTTVPVLSAPAPNLRGPRFTVDGGDVTAVGLAGAQMGFSQEVVQEFQVSTVNSDLSAGMTASGSVNVVTRAGTNELHGTAFDFFRDHDMAACPALKRDPNNADPFFRRQQFGFAVGGPLRRNRLFYFGTWERNDQQAVAPTTVLAADFASLSRVTRSPLLGTLFSARVDMKITDSHTAFVRHSHDGSRTFAPIAITSNNAYPSNWNRGDNKADQSLIALASVLRPTLVSDLRASYFVVGSSSGKPDDQDCANCLGLSAPSINIPQAGLLIGNSLSNDNEERRFELTESLTWQRGTHRARLGADWEYSSDRNLIRDNDPVSMTLFSPDQVRAFNATVSEQQRIPLPATFRTLDDILQLPVQSLTIGVGDPGIPQERGGSARRWSTVWLYAEDAWRTHDRLTPTYGLGWGFDGILNHDLRKPLLLAPILGADGLGPTRRNWTNFAPSAGLVWVPSSSRKTVVRAGAGRYYQPEGGLTSSMDNERVALGPPGLGRQTFVGASIRNPLPNIPGVPVGTLLDFRTAPTRFTGTALMTSLPGIRASLFQTLASSDAMVQQVQIAKQVSGNSAAIFPVDVPTASAVHLNAGVQRELARNLVVSADVVYRHFAHVPQNSGFLDLNHFMSARGPVIPMCTAALASDAAALCSRGPINVYVAPYRSTYTGLLVRAEQRVSSGVQILGSYAYSKNSGINAGNGFNLDNWLDNTGPINDFTHVFSFAGALQLPRQFELGVNFSYSSAPPFTAYVGRIDFNGDGTMNDLLPGATVNVFNRGMDRRDLERLVAKFNDTYAGTKDAQGTLIPRLTLPARYGFDDNYHSLDLRVSRPLSLRQGARVTLIAEVFNVFNAANLSGYSGDLTSPAFGQPTSRAIQVFGSGGPRAFQLAARVGF